MTDSTRQPNDGTATETRTDARRCVRLPDHVEAKIERRLPRTNFGSVDEYVVFALESLLRELDDGDEHVETVPEDHEGTAENSEEIRDRLESLGYL